MRSSDYRLRELQQRKECGNPCRNSCSLFLQMQNTSSVDVLWKHKVFQKKKWDESESYFSFADFPWSSHPSSCYSRTSIIRTSIIRISRLSGLFLWSQFGHEYLLVTIKIRSHILFETKALKGAVKCECFCSQRAKAALAFVVSNEEHLNEFWLD